MRQEQWSEIASLTAGLSAESLLSWAARRFGPRVAFASSLGAEDQVLTDLISRVAPSMPIFTIDTGRLPQETYDLIEATRTRYGIVHRGAVSRPRPTSSRWSASRGPNLFYDSVEDRKALLPRPEGQARCSGELAALDAWITGLRREQAVTRADLQAVEWDEANGLIKINPLADWTDGAGLGLHPRHDVPYNALHDRGYPSIGCAPCTRAVAPGEDIRAGRWWWEQPGAQGMRPARGGRQAGARTRQERRHGPSGQTLEAQSVFILREAYREFKQLVMLWSIGKDSTVLLWLARKAFFGHVPFPLMHIDTHYKIPEMIEYRDRLAREWKLNMIVGRNDAALAEQADLPRRRGHAAAVLRGAQERGAEAHALGRVAAVGAGPRDRPVRQDRPAASRSPA